MSDRIEKRIIALISNPKGFDVLQVLRNCSEEFSRFPEEEAKLCEFAELFNYLNDVSFSEFVDMIYSDQYSLPSNISNSLKNFLNLMCDCEKMVKTH